MKVYASAGSTMAWLVLLLSLSLVSVLPRSVQAAGVLPGAGGGSESTGAEPVQLPENLSREEVRDLLSRLSDDQVRELLIRELDKEVVASEKQSQGAQSTGIDRLHDTVGLARSRLVEIFGARDRLSSLPGDLWAQITFGGLISSWTIVLGLVFMFAAGAIAEFFVRRAIRDVGSRQVEQARMGLGARLGGSGMRILLNLLALTVFALGALLAMCIVVWENDAPEAFFLMLLATVLAVRVFLILLDAVVAPKAPGLRWVPLSDDGAKALHSRLAVLAGILIIDRVLVASLDAYGVDFDVMELLGFAVASVFVCVVIVVIWQARAAYAAIMLGDDEAAADGGFRRTLANHWHLLAIAGVIAIFMLSITVASIEGEAYQGGGLKTLILLMMLPLIDAGLRRGVARIFRPQEEVNPGEGEPAAPGEASLTLAPAGETQEAKLAGTAEIQAVVLKNLRILLGLVVMVVFLQFWGVELDTLLQTLFGDRVASAFFDIVVTLLLAYAVWSVVKATVAYHMGPEEEKEEGAVEGEIGGSGQTRLQTLLPLFRKVILITLVVMGILIVLSALGVNIGPLIAGAGVVGIAIGFGAQTLVRDIVSGVFFLLDDAFRKGEYVEMGNIRGVVEGISIRSLRLRHHRGPLHTIPFGEIKTLTNYSRDYAIMKFELRLPFETDINKVRRIIKNIGKEMENDEELASMMLGPLKSQGVNRMDDSALIIRCKFTALPGQQFLVRREAFTRIQQAFEQNGIQFAPRRVIVEAATPALAMAAAGALDSEADQQKGAAAKSDDRG